MRLAIVSAAIALMVMGVAWGAWRISQLHARELDYTSEAQSLGAARNNRGSTSVSTRLATVALQAGEHVVFEVCSDDGMPENAWAGAVDFVVFQLKPLKLLLRVPMDRAHLDVVKRNRHGACMALGGGALEVTGQHAIDVVWPGKPFPAAIADSPLRVRVLAREPLNTGDRVPVLLIAAGALLLVLGLFFTARMDDVATPREDHTPRALTAIAVGMSVLVAGWFASAYVGPFGPTWGLLKTSALGAIEVACAWWLAKLAADHTPTAALRLLPPVRSRWLWLAAAPLIGLALNYSASFALRVVPSTGESAIETFISWPSGMLAFGTIGVLVPLCEELFFRGFVYTRATVLGPMAAFAITAISFVALHAAQTWGNWGSLLSITITGIVLTSLRAVSGSTLIPALAHIVYNLSLTLRSL